MTYKFKSAELVFPPAPPPLPSGSVYANPGYPCAAFAAASGEDRHLTLSDLRDILVHKTKESPADIPFGELRTAFRVAIQLVPHTHSDITAADIAAAYNTHPEDRYLRPNPA